MARVVGQTSLISHSKAVLFVSAANPILLETLEVGNSQSPKQGQKEDASALELDDSRAEGISKLKLAQEVLTFAMSSPQGARQLSQRHRFRLTSHVCSRVKFCALAYR